MRQKSKISYMIEFIFGFALIINPGYSLAQSTSIDTMMIADINHHIRTTSVEENIEELHEGSGSIPQAILQGNYFSGDWWGLRTSFSNVGVKFGFVYKGEIFSNTLGGFNKGTEKLDNFDLVISSDLSKNFGLNNTNLLVQFLGNSGGTPCDLVGAIQGVSNIETISTWKLYQLLLERSFFDESLSLLVGLYDLNSEFDTKETSSIFINPSHGIGPDFSQSGLNGPSIFPTTSVAFRVKYESGNGNYLQAVILDGVPGDPENPYGTHIQFNENDGYLLAAEYGIVNSENEKLNSKLAIGVWTYSTLVNNYELDSAPEYLTNTSKNFGFYLNAEKLLLNNDSKLYGFTRIGFANKNVNPIDFYWGGGVRLTGLFSDNDTDEFGFAFAYAHNSHSYQNYTFFSENINIREYEINFEATYSLKLTPWLKIQPDLQYILNPSYCIFSRHAFLVGTRLELHI